MLLVCFTLSAEGADPIVSARIYGKGSTKSVYSGPLSLWDSLKTHIRKYGKCVICFYEGAAVMTISKTENKDLAIDIISNARMVSDVFPDDPAVLCFADRSIISEPRRTLCDAGAAIILEHLIPDSLKLTDESLTDYYNRICKRELSLKNGTIDERKMMAYRLAQIKAILLPVLSLVLLLSILSSITTIRTSEKRLIGKSPWEIY